MSYKVFNHSGSFIVLNRYVDNDYKEISFLCWYVPLCFYYTLFYFGRINSESNDTLNVNLTSFSYVTKTTDYNFKNEMFYFWQYCIKMKQITITIQIQLKWMTSVNNNIVSKLTIQLWNYIFNQIPTVAILVVISIDLKIMNVMSLFLFNFWLNCSSQFSIHSITKS